MQLDLNEKYAFGCGVGGLQHANSIGLLAQTTSRFVHTLSRTFSGV
jgi:hypothetical protein